MAGTLIRILPRTDFVMTPVGSTAQETALNLFDATIFTSMIVVARIHAKSGSTGSTQTLNVFFRNTAPTAEDITTDFPGVTVGTGTFTISGSSTGPLPPQIVACVAPLSYKMRLILSASQSVAGTAFTFSLSVDGLGRE